MDLKNRAATLMDEECRLLASLLEIEDRNYCRLLRLAWRQNSYMKRQDVDRLDTNSREWSRYLPEADMARLGRERYMGDLARKLGLSMPPAKIQDLLDYVDPGLRKEINLALDKLIKTTGALARQNEANRSLAQFCIDLAKEEAEIFKNTILDDPQGCYGDDAQASNRGPGGLFIKQA
jgi:hypothetical protein